MFTSKSTSAYADSSDQSPKQRIMDKFYANSVSTYTLLFEQTNNGVRRQHICQSLLEYVYKLHSNHTTAMLYGLNRKSNNEQDVPDSSITRRSADSSQSGRLRQDVHVSRQYWTTSPRAVEADATINCPTRPRFARKQYRLTIGGTSGSYHVRRSHQRSRMPV